MNSNSDSDSRQDFYTSQRIRQDGLILNTTRHSCSSVYRPKTEYSQRKPKSAKGSKGLSDKQKEGIDVAVNQLITEYGIENVHWSISTFDETASDEALHNIAIAIEQLIKDIKYRLRTAYKKHSIEPCIMIVGLKERTSRGKKIPCFDINIIYAIKDKDGNQLLDVPTLHNGIYLAASKRAKERIEIPSNHYNHPITNSLENWRQLANYAKIQQNLGLLASFQNTEYASKLPNTWAYIPASLKQTISDITVKYPGIKASEIRKLMQDNLSEYVTILDKEEVDCKSIAQLKPGISREEFVSQLKQVIDLMQSEEKQSLSVADLIDMKQRYPDAYAVFMEVLDNIRNRAA